MDPPGQEATPLAKKLPLTKEGLAKGIGTELPVAYPVAEGR